MSDFNLDLTVLRMLKTRERYERYAKMVPEGTVNDTTKKFIKRFGEYFESTGAETVTYEQFWPFLRSRYPKWKDKDVAFWDAATRPIDTDNPAGYDAVVLRNLIATDLANKALNYIEEWQSGGEVDLFEALRAAGEAADAVLERRVRTPEVTLGWDEMIEEDEHNVGLHWRLGCVGRHMRALRPGDFGIFAMRPDRGKTSWVASEVTHWAGQLDELDWAKGRPILWLNNEGPGRRILARLRTAGLGLNATEVRAMGPAKARSKYESATAGGDARILVRDIHSFSHVEVEELIRKENPAVVVFDMIDNIHFGGGMINGGSRTDQILEAMYQWARGLGVKHEFVGIATSQISADGEGERWPQQTWLKDSRTGKQGACDFILTGGFDPSMPNTRFIGATKNKIKLEGAQASPECQVFFDADRSRLREPEEA